MVCKNCGKPGHHFHQHYDGGYVCDKCIGFYLHVLHVESYMISMILNMGMPEEENVFPVEIRAMLINYIWALRNCIKKIAKHYTNRIDVKYKKAFPEGNAFFMG